MIKIIVSTTGICNSGLVTQPEEGYKETGEDTMSCNQNDTKFGGPFLLREIAETGSNHPGTEKNKRRLDSNVLIVRRNGET